MFRYIPFQDIEKNKWNGTVHYSPNGNVFGHYWFLRSVYKQWDAIVEDDYISVIPILPKVHKSLYKLTPELGPYSVNPITEERGNSLLELMKERSSSPYYPINHAIGTLETTYTNEDILYQEQELHLIDPYDSIISGYNEEGTKLIESVNREDVTFLSSIKPETILTQTGKYSKPQRDALIRTMYNAIHRGIGWSQGITDKNSGKYLALSFYVVSHNVIHEIFNLDHSSVKYRLLNYDIFLRTGAGKPSLLKTYNDSNMLDALGFKATERRIVKIKDNKNSWWRKLLD